eukprot:TRINITY_DN51156_c0_g1_i1.p1 TRINITY_DN51156_c0_g1~~TRINITY_DN51156_c0_g1_i1.p1  ORF type:complete len:888 (-),score=94.72 TRINITY_DN51156_c0_g1_i1:30-2693(-)
MPRRPKSNTAAARGAKNARKRSDTGPAARLSSFESNATLNSDEYEPTEDRTGTASLTGDQASSYRGYNWLGEAGCQYGREPPSIDEVVQMGIPLSVFVAYLKSEMSDESSLKSLPFAILLIVSFALMFISHDAAIDIQGIETAVDFDLEENAVFAYSTPGWMGFKSMYDVNSYADFWSWLRIGLMSLLFADSVPSSEVSNMTALAMQNATEKAYYVYHNRKIGALRLRQERSTPMTCPNELLRETFGKPCTTDASGLLPDIEPEEFEIIESTITEDPSRTKFIRFLTQEQGRNVADEIAFQLEKEGWVDESTARAEITFILYNANSDILALNSITFVFARTGHIWKRLTHRSLVLDPYRDKLSYLWDFMFYGQITFIFLKEAKEVVHELREAQYNFRVFLKGYLDAWNVVDWMSIVVAYTILGTWIYQVLMTWQLSSQFSTLQQDQERCLETHEPSVCDKELSEFFDFVFLIGNFVQRLRTVFATYPVLIILRLFKAFSAQPRLSVVTRTLAKAFVDLYHFGIVFMVVFATYVVSGTIIFGRELGHFTTFGRSCVTLFRALLGDFEIEDMRKVGRGIATAFFSTFMIFMVFVTLNMLVAILMDVYEEIKQSVASSETLFAQVGEFLERARENRFSGRTSVKKMFSGLKAKYGEELDDVDVSLTVSDLVQAIPKLKREQARAELAAATEKHRATNETDPTTVDVQLGLASLRQRLPYFIKKLTKGSRNGKTNGNGNGSHDAMEPKKGLDATEARKCNGRPDLKMATVDDFTSSYPLHGSHSLSSLQLVPFQPRSESRRTEPRSESRGWSKPLDQGEVFEVETMAMEASDTLAYQLAEFIPTDVLLQAARLQLDAQLPPPSVFPPARSLRTSIQAVCELYDDLTISWGL